MDNSHKPGSKFDSRVVAYTRWVLRWRWPIVITTFLVTLLVASGGRFLTFNTEYRAFFSKENPQLASFEALQNVYTKNDNILFVLAPKDSEVFTASTLAAIEKLTAEAWKIPFALRVDAVTNFQHTQANGDELIVADLVSTASEQTSGTLKAARQIALAEPLLAKRLISSQGHVTGVNVTLQFPGADAITELPQAVNHARELAQSLHEEYPSLDIYLTGVAMLSNAFSEAGAADMQTLVPLMYVAMLLIIFISLRSINGTLATFLVITFSILVAMGIAGFMRVGLTPPSLQTPTIIMTLAIADCIHILLIVMREMSQGKSKWNAIVESIRVNMQPVFLTSFTTAIGFLTLNFSDVPPFNHLGNMTAVGVMAAWVYAVLFLPAFIAILPLRAPKVAETRASFIDKFADFVIRRRRALLWSSAFTVLALAAFIPRNEIRDDFVQYFAESIRFRTDTDFMLQNLTGVYQIEYSLGGGESGSISDPGYLAKVEEFANWYRQQPGVLHVSTYTDIVKRLNKNMHGDDAEFYRLPQERELAAQYLLLYEMSLPYGLDLNNQINVDKSATRFTVTLENISSPEIKALTEKGQQWLRENAPAAMFSYGSGPAVMFSYISEKNISSMVKGGLLGLILISLVVIVALRDVKIGITSLIPNLVPIIMAFGVWAFVAARVDTAVSIVFGMTMGIVVDDTIHFLSKYLRARREKGLSAASAVRYAFSSVGAALIATSIILMIGFGILSMSAFAMNGNMAKLTTLTIVLALLADFLFLPPLLMKLEEKKQPVSFGKKVRVAQPAPARVRVY